MADQYIALPGLRMERRRRTDSSEMLVQHLHSFYELYYLLDGRRQYFISNKAYYIQSGTIVLIRPGQIHRTTMLDENSHERVLLEIDELYLENISPRFKNLLNSSFQNKHALVIPFDNRDRGRVEWLLTDLFEEARAKEHAYQEYANIRVEEILLLLLRRQLAFAVPEIKSNKHNRVYEIADYISENYKEIIALEDICKKFFLCKAHLCHIFKEVTGMTVQEYLTSTRIKQAQQLLTMTKLPVTTVAEETGYNSITHFERMFKRLTGMTPLQYRATAGAE